jgi:two-component system response regulator GlrR
MVIDDDRQFCKLLKIMLEMDGYRVTTHQEIESARIQLEQEPPDLLCCDLNLAGDSGYDFLARRQDIQGLLGVPIIAITGDYRQSNRARATQLGVFAYLIKPVAKNELLATVQSALCFDSISTKAVMPQRMGKS